MVLLVYLLQGLNKNWWKLSKAEFLSTNQLLMQVVGGIKDDSVAGGNDPEN